MIENSAEAKQETGAMDMAYEIGDGVSSPAATGGHDLLNKMIAFCTSNGWTLNKDTGIEENGRWVNLEGVGDAGANPIINFRVYQKTNLFSLVLKMSSAFEDTTFDLQPNPSTAYTPSDDDYYEMPTLQLVDREMAYCFICDNQHIKVISMSGNSVFNGYFGMMERSIGAGNPVSPEEYPRPFFVGGAANKTGLSEAATDGAGSFFANAGDSSTATRQLIGASYVFDGANWFPVLMQRGSVDYTDGFGYVVGYSGNTSQTTAYPSLNLSYMLEPVAIGTTRNPSLAFFRGCHKVSGYNLSPFNMFNDGVDNYIVTRTFTSVDENLFMAMRLA